VAKAALLDELGVAAGDAPRLEARDSGARLGAKDKQAGKARLLVLRSQAGAGITRLEPRRVSGRHAQLVEERSLRHRASMAG